MNRRTLATSLLVSCTMVGGGSAMADQDRWTLKAPNGISFSEFKGYERWEMIASSMPDNEGGCGSSKAPGCIKAIAGNPQMIKAYKAGIPENGTAVPDGVVFAKIEWVKAREEVPYGVFVPGELAEVAFMVKDSKRFPATNGWGYATFQYNSASDTWKSKEGDASFGAAECHGCHTVVKSNDFVFTHYPKR